MGSTRVGSNYSCKSSEYRRDVVLVSRYNTLHTAVRNYERALAAFQPLFLVPSLFTLQNTPFGPLRHFFFTDRVLEAGAAAFLRAIGAFRGAAAAGAAPPANLPSGVRRVVTIVFT